jgi:hypothetical protein
MTREVDDFGTGLSQDDIVRYLSALSLDEEIPAGFLTVEQWQALLSHAGKELSYKSVRNLLDDRVRRGKVERCHVRRGGTKIVVFKPK